MIPEHIDAFVPSWQELKQFRRGINQAVVLTTIHEQPFALLYYCGIDDLPSAASEAQTNGSSVG
jgi:hypothetical protein